MNVRVVIVALALTLGYAVLSPLLASTAPVGQGGYSAEVRERMIVRNLAPPRLGDSVRPVLARDVGAGHGIFEYSYGPIGFGWPMVTRTGDWPHESYCIALLDSSGHLLSRSSIPETGWPSWDSVINVAESGNQPMSETHNIASSRAGDRACITWVRTDTSPMPGYYRLSSDAGATWGPVTELAPPPAYGGDTLTSFHVSSLYPFYDSSARLHVMAAVHPIVHDTALIMPAGIWHWCPDWQPKWLLIRRAGCAPEHLAAPVGYNALYACRPSGTWWRYGQRAALAVWEQFDSSDVDPLTNLLRAKIYLALFEENGVFEVVCVSESGPFSCRFPVIAHGEEMDTVRVQYEIDQVAGFYPLGQGPCTRNPVVVRRFFLGWPPGLRQLDTIGGTTYDLQTCGPAHPTLSLAPGWGWGGVHAIWACCSDTSRTFPDLHVRYNFYYREWACWNWIDPFDFMQSGAFVFVQLPVAFGCVTSNPTTGAAMISACTPAPLPPTGATERLSTPARSDRRAATLARGVLLLGADSRQHTAYRAELLDVAGREVMGLKPGANDVRALSPGIYFVREAGAQAQAVRKVVVAR